MRQTRTGGELSMNIRSTRSNLARARMIRSARRSRGSRLYSRNNSASTNNTNKVNSSSSTTKSKQIALYEKVEKSANAVTNSIKNMLEIAKKTEITDKDKQKMISEVKDFVANYNNVHSASNEAAGGSDPYFEVQVGKVTTEYKAGLEKIGITISKSGELTVDSKKLEAADFEDIKSVFCKEEGYGTEISERFSAIQESAASTVNLLDRLYGTSTYNKYGNTSYYGGNYGSYGDYDNTYGGSIYNGKYYGNYNSWG